MKVPTILALTALSSAPLIAEPDAAVMAQGQAAAAVCLACHGPDGQGLDLGPAGKMAPSLTASKVALGNPESLGLSILKGIKKEDAKYVGIMAPLEASFKKPDGTFDAEKMAALMTFVRNSYGNEGEAVTAEEAQATYEKYKDRTDPATREELTKLSEAGEAGEAGEEGEEAAEPGE